MRLLAPICSRLRRLRTVLATAEGILFRRMSQKVHFMKIITKILATDLVKTLLFIHLPDCHCQ